MNEAIPPTDFLKKDTINCIIEKMGAIRGVLPLDNEDEAERVMLDDIKTAIPYDTDKTYKNSVEQGFEARAITG